MSSITVVGAGYVGLVSAASFARLGHDVTCVEIDPARVRALRRNRLPIREPGLTELWMENVRQGRLRVTGDYSEALRDCSFVFLAVGTPSRHGGGPDVRQVLEATREIARNLDGRERPIVVIKSTVPIGTAELAARVLQEHCRATPPRVVSNPEFLREGQAVCDFLRPTRIVIGSDDREAGEAVAALYQQLRRPVIFCTSRTAEMVKYASNAFLGTKISFVNEIASVCEGAGIDVTVVSKVLGLDSRIGNGYLDAGLGWGGSCLPKDIDALIWTGSRLGISTPMLRSAVRVNKQQPALVVSKLSRMLGSLRGATIGVWGLAFKPNCDDIRESPAIRLIRLLLAEGCQVRAFDPLAMEATARQLPEVTYCRDAYEAAAGSEAIVLATHWSGFDALDLSKVRSLMVRPILVDARNALEIERVVEAGFAYAGIGRPVHGMELADACQPPVALPLGQRRRKASAQAKRAGVPERTGSGPARPSDVARSDASSPRMPAVEKASTQRWVHGVSKRLMDIVVSLTALVLLSPLFAILALLIRRDSPGPAFFRQERIGRNGRTFTMLKFRTMRQDADDRLHREAVRRAARGIRTASPNGKLVFKPPDDPRVTGMGKFLRSWSLDELPQLINVVRGEMSLVGPRPALEYELPYYKEWHHQRFAVRPGLTGLWQVRRREAKDFDEMMRMDVQYSGSFSIWHDVKLIAMTIPAIVRERGVF